MNDIFSIFNPDWWMDENNNALQMTDAVLFLLLAIPVAYLFIYALASLRKYKNPYPPSPKRHRFLVLFVVLLSACGDPAADFQWGVLSHGPLCCAEKRQGSDRVHQSFP